MQEFCTNRKKTDFQNQEQSLGVSHVVHTLYWAKLSGETSHPALDKPRKRLFKSQFNTISEQIICNYVNLGDISYLAKTFSA